MAGAVDIPILLYNVAKRTGVDLHFATVERLACIPSIVGIKDASGDLDRPRVTALTAGPRFLQFCGDDAQAVAFDPAGGRGCISVAADVVPALCRDLQRLCRTKNWSGARELQHRLEPLVAALGRESNPGPVKQALALVRPGFSREPRLPLVGAGEEAAAEIGAALAALGLPGETDGGAWMGQAAPVAPAAAA